MNIFQVQQDPEHQEHHEEGRHQLPHLPAGAGEEVPAVHKHLGGDRQTSAQALQGIETGTERESVREMEKEREKTLRWDSTLGGWWVVGGGGLGWVE